MLSLPATENPFKFGTVVDGSFFTERTEELPRVQQMLSGHNHLALISPRRYGKTGLVRKAILQTGRPAIFINVQMAMSAGKLAELLLKSFFAIHPWERIKDAFRKFRIIPKFSFDPETGQMEIFLDAAFKGQAALEDVLNLINEKSDPSNRLIVVLDEFQEIANLEVGTDKLLRAVMQLHDNINYLFLGSEESMMTAIFEDIKSPFFHFGALMHLGRIPYEDFFTFLIDRLTGIRAQKAQEDVRAILALTKCHPFYTQQLASVFWNLCARVGDKATVEDAANEIMRNLSMTYTTLWSRLNITNRRVLETLARGSKLQDIRELPASTLYSAAARMKKEGLLVRETDYELEDPFFALWIRRSIQEAALGLTSRKEM